MYRAPIEGSMAWVDGMAIPTGAKNIDQIYAFIEVAYDAEPAGKAIDTHGYNSPVLGADKHASAQYAKNFSDAYPGDAQTNIFERCFVTGVTEAKAGAHPTSMPPLYGPDMGALKAYTGAAKDPGEWKAVSDQFVGADEAAYLASVGGEEAVMNVPLAIY